MEGFQSAEAISGRAIGVFFFAGFGCLWLCTGLAAMHRLNVLSGIGVGVLLLLLILPATRLLRQSLKSAVVDAQHEARVKRTFNRVNSIQWIAILVGVVIANLLQKGYLIVPVIATIVGLHLFPLGRLFRYPAHYVTGTLLVFWSAGVVLMLDPDDISSTGALGTAAILLASAAYTLIAAKRASEQVSGQPLKP